MIKASELRIGNYIYHMGEVVIVDAVDSDGSLNILADHTGNISSRCDIADPIPITYEILEKCGFIDPSSNGWGRRLYLNDRHELAWYLQDQQLYGESHVKYQTRGSGFSHDFGVKYLHQVQNLYFAIKGEELNVQL